MCVDFMPDSAQSPMLGVSSHGALIALEAVPSLEYLSQYSGRDENQIFIFYFASFTYQTPLIFSVFLLTFTIDRHKHPDTLPSSVILRQIC